MATSWMFICKIQARHSSTQLMLVLLHCDRVSSVLAKATVTRCFESCALMRISFVEHDLELRAQEVVKSMLEQQAATSCLM